MVFLLGKSLQAPVLLNLKEGEVGRYKRVFFFEGDHKTTLLAGSELSNQTL